MNIARIVSSNSHIDYIGRVIDDLDVNDPPAADDYGFGQFVSLSLAGAGDIIGVIYDSMLVNPEYASFGPRLSPKPELANFSVDFINEQGVLLGILLLGTLDEDGHVTHGVPRRIVPAGQEVVKLDREDIRRFHMDENNAMKIHYYSQVVNHAGPIAVSLLESIIDQLTIDCAEPDRQRLGVLKQTLGWQRTMGGMRL
ncbi:MAG TPA: hypothetical protein VGP12_03660 [Nitrosospira sp.]|jgi:hypothetical protein|nr:hypothetical protein [Nitrosospira sp.]